MDARDLDLQNRFTYHQPSDLGPVMRYGEIRDGGYRLAMLIDRACPDSREKSLAITHLEEAVMWANASIARNE